MMQFIISPSRTVIVTGLHLAIGQVEALGGGIVECQWAPSEETF